MCQYCLVRDEKGKYRLSPTYDQVSTALVMPEDAEELALPLQGFKMKLMPFDFVYAMTDSGLDAGVAEKLLLRFQKYRQRWFDCIDSSFITEEQKTQFKTIIATRLNTLLK